MGDVMPSDRERERYPGQKFDAAIRSEKITYVSIVLFCKWLCEF
jgi:hypothetical protein